LYLPESWIGDQERRTEAGIPKEVEFQKKWQLALESVHRTEPVGLATNLGTLHGLNVSIRQT
jgi:hypothetical protein